MSIAMEDVKSVNTLEEVKKLQELVRKLEIQNLHLRNKQMTQKRAISPTKTSKLPQKSNILESDPVNQKESDASNGKCDDKVEYFGDLEIIRVSDIEMSDDESWLYSSPNSEHRISESRINPENAKSKDLQFTKNALLAKLNELEILSSPRSYPDLNYTNVCNSQNSYKTKSSFNVPKRDAVQVDSRTFTRSRKKEALDFLEKLDIKKNENSIEFEADERLRDMSLDSTSSYMLEGANDVQEVARLQEESLRRNSPLTTPRRFAGCSISKSVLNFAKESPSDQDVFERRPFDSPVNANEAYMDEYCHVSDTSSHSESPYGSDSSLHNVEQSKAKLGTYRRSLPNLSRDSTVNRVSPVQTASQQRTAFFVKEESKSNNQTYKRPSKYLTKTQQSKMSTPENNNTVSMFPKSADSVNRRSNVRSGLPRSSRAGSSSRAVSRSGIPMSSVANKKYGEDSWSEGCY